MALTQKPIAGQCFSDPSGPPAWRGKPSWYQVSGQDRMIPPETERWMAERTGARETEATDAGHASLASHPPEVTHLTLRAAAELSSRRKSSGCSSGLPITPNLLSVIVTYKSGKQCFTRG